MGAFKNLFLSSVVASLASAHGDLAKRAGLTAGTIYDKCVSSNHVALTFDDGPAQYTQNLMTQLAKDGHKVTFFVCGNNYGKMITDYTAEVQGMIAAGHQVASHTYSHANLGELDEAGVTSEMTKLEDQLAGIIGKIPTVMRPPYLSTSATAIEALRKLGYAIVNIDNDTYDWQEGPAGRIQNSINWYQTNFTAGRTLSLNHDPLEWTVNTFMPDTLTFLKQKGKVSVTVATCLGVPEADMYRPPRNAVSSSRAASSSTVRASSSSARAASSSSARPVSSSSARPASSSSARAVSSSSARPASSASRASSGAPASSGYPSSSRGPASSQPASSGAPVSSGSPASSRGPSSRGPASSRPTSAQGPASSRGASPSSRGGSPSSRGSSPSSAGSPKPSGITSPNWSCGGDKGYVCPSGYCCSPYGWCGKSSTYCGVGCQSSFGTCSAGSGSGNGGSNGGSGSTPTGPIDGKNGKCGGSTGYVCPGNCCSQYGYCGSSKAYCGAGCQSAFGTCSK